MKRLQDKVALITGGNAGIGKAAALLFAQEGARVVVAARREDEGAQTVAEIIAQGGEAMFVRADVSSSADCAAMVTATVKRYGRLDVAFNNAGVVQYGKTVIELEEEEWDRVLAINLKGVFLSMKHEIPEMLKTGGGAIVNNSSIGGLVVIPGMSAYQSSKHGLIGLTKVAALEFAARNVRVNAICPAGTETPMIAGWTADPELKQRLVATHPIGRLADPIEPARAALFLASDEASFITGVALPVDGGSILP
ncbi:SDR family NAD(P)-dependent oxidoreductase [Sorangium sp. So ce590]|uniref:SDR family NAD(P)-dependent oxidoreductase n=1 Tax=unclassified Sorangium TaxID=2621164 RepID=UPI003F60FA56